MAWWQRQFGDSTRGRIVALLRRGRRSVDDLAVELGVTDNAVRAQLASLTRDGVVTDVGPRREGTVGKPATLYAIADQASTALSDAYAPALASLLDVLGERYSKKELEALMREVGRRLGPKAPTPSSTLEARVHGAVRFLGELGAMADVEREGAAFTVKGHGCPLGKAVAARPEACRAVEQLLVQATGARVHEQCDRTHGAPHCSFVITERASH